tara:strand:+ start:132 stop:308 length:177 start_codon:yes stop_codon:yes gene_type:complete
MPVANMLTNAKQDAQIRALYQDLNRLSAAVENELLKIDKVAGDDDVTILSEQLTYLLI